MDSSSKIKNVDFITDIGSQYIYTADLRSVIKKLVYIDHWPKKLLW